MLLFLFVIDIVCQIIECSNFPIFSRFPKMLGSSVVNFSLYLLEIVRAVLQRSYPDISLSLWFKIAESSAQT